MHAAINPPMGNHLLDGLSHQERSRVLLHCEPVELRFGTVLSEPGQSFRYLYFPLTSFISIGATQGRRRPIELGMIGSEGMLGATLALGINSAPSRAVVQGSGSALRIGVAQLHQLLGKCPQLLHTLQRYLYVMLMQLAQNVVCGHFHEVEPRLAHWLLMIHDRARGNRFHLTHECLSDMLGVRRSSITVAAGALQQRQLIHYSRGHITILDRSGLEAAACECYASLTESYTRLLHGLSHAPT
ncbi:MAG TPA: Crp/Fnr family transcriptional regulator [Pseudomonas sp.]|nr:Crp/Fnr family transcriptional regulator [Pseudomonas sp.]